MQLLLQRVPKGNWARKMKLLEATLPSPDRNEPFKGVYISLVNWVQKVWTSRTLEVRHGERACRARIRFASSKVSSCSATTRDSRWRVPTRGRDPPGGPRCLCCQTCRRLPETCARGIGSDKRVQEVCIEYTIFVTIVSYVDKGYQGVKPQSNLVSMGLVPAQSRI